MVEKKGAWHIKLHSRTRSIESSIENNWPQFLGVPRKNFVETLTGCRSYPKVVIETKRPDHFATKVEFLS